MEWFMSKAKLKIIGYEQTFEIKEDLSLLEVMLSNNIAINHSCGGMGSCGTCRVVVKEGVSNLPPRNKIESEMAKDRGFAIHERLSCQLLRAKDLIVEIP